MDNVDNNEINKSIGKIIQKYRLKMGLTQETVAEKLSKSSKTISQIETGKDGTSKKTDVDFMNLLEIAPNELYREFIINKNIKRKIELFDKIDKLNSNQIEAIEKFIDIIKNL